MWDLSRSGIESMSPALAGGFFTPEPPGKPFDSSLFFLPSLMVSLFWVSTLNIIVCYFPL